MEFLWASVEEWLRELLTDGIRSNLSGLFDAVNRQVAGISGQVGQTPQEWNPGIYSMIRNLSETVMMPIAGAVLAIVMTIELIQMISDRNSLHDVDTWMFFRWGFKSAAAVLLVTNTWNIVMSVFEISRELTMKASGLIRGSTAVEITADLDARLEAMKIGPLFGLWFQSLFISVTMWAMSICIFIIIHGRMMEIYLAASIAPVPAASMMSREAGGMGQNYLRSLAALGIQAFLIMVCVAVYAVLVQNIAVQTDIFAALWSCTGYTVLLCFTLFKTGSLAKSVFNAH